MGTQRWFPFQLLSEARGLISLIFVHNTNEFRNLAAHGEKLLLLRTPTSQQLWFTLIKTSLAGQKGKKRSFRTEEYLQLQNGLSWLYWQFNTQLESLRFLFFILMWIVNSCHCHIHPSIHRSIHGCNKGVSTLQHGRGLTKTLYFS